MFTITIKTHYIPTSENQLDHPDKLTISIKTHSIPTMGTSSVSSWQVHFLRKNTWNPQHGNTHLYLPHMFTFPPWHIPTIAQILCIILTCSLLSSKHTISPLGHKSLLSSWHIHFLHYIIPLNHGKNLLNLPDMFNIPIKAHYIPTMAQIICIFLTCSLSPSKQL